MNAFNKIDMTGQLLDKTSIELNSRHVCIPLEFNSVITPYCLPAFKILRTKIQSRSVKDPVVRLHILKIGTPEQARKTSSCQRHKLVE